MATKRRPAPNSKLIKFGKSYIPTAHAMHVFRHLYPDIDFADITLRHLLVRKMSAKKVVDYWNDTTPRRPRGVAGERTPPDPAIVAQYPGLAPEE